MAALILFSISCGAGGSGDTGTPAGTFRIIVQAKAGDLTVTTPVTLVVRWSPGGGAG
jgi:hypothetical protein